MKAFSPIAETNALVITAVGQALISAAIAPIGIITIFTTWRTTIATDLASSSTSFTMRSMNLSQKPLKLTRKEGPRVL